ncbi:hypothetical protein [Clostridium paridis]|uniref:VOC domain-containing protein n=1 Tax=Clostridium paridis TaxID=2803863 RepID=A0A937FDG0_9CLOT|nr:hypothetical protein [Clostridium paridis]MBL4931208.1 hypothetical protein [Clostridium paridis]
MIEGISHITFIERDLEKTTKLFKSLISEVEYYLNKIKELNLELKPPRERVPGEGYSIYFYDYDNNLFELHTETLEKRLESYSNINNFNEKMKGDLSWKN